LTFRVRKPIPRFTNTSGFAQDPRNDFFALLVYKYRSVVVSVSSDMSGHKPLLFSERCRVLAQECRAKAQSFRNEKPRLQMLQLADDYERRALQAEEIEASLRVPHDESPSLIPEIAEAFVNQLKT
jgi:GTP-sensing pleiotropic transcriptional regulator CodY